MIATPLLASLPAGARVLAIGAHADDIEIGCGGTLLRLLGERGDVALTWVVLSARGARADEARASAAAYLGAAGDVVVADFRDGYLPYVGGEVKDLFEELKARVEPQLVLTHARDDLHQDHRLACELTWNTWRDHLVLEYEIPKVDGDLGRPNVFVALSEEQLERKVALLHEHFATQRSKHWFTPDLFRGLARVRGMEGRAASGLAEAFVARKVAV